MNSECREDARKDDAKLVAARTAYGTPLCEHFPSFFEEKIVNLEPIIVYSRRNVEFKVPFLRARHHFPLFFLI